MLIEATTDGKRILVRSFTVGDKEFQRAYEGAKSVPGGRWQKAEKVWAYPLAVDVCHALRRAYGDALKVLPPLGAWYRQAAAQQAAHADLSAATDADLLNLPTTAPRLAATLRADQRVGAKWIAEGYRGAGLVADKPGLGKTLETLAGILESDVHGPIIVVCPRLSVRPVWEKEIRRWTDLPVYAARGTRAQRDKVIAAFLKDDSDRKVLVVVAEMLRVKEEKDDMGKPQFVGFEFPELFEVPWAWQVVDESHKMFGSLTVVRGNLMGKGLKRLPLAPHGRRLAVTGTPFGKGGRVQGMFGTLHWLWPDEYTSFWRWAGMYFQIDEEQVYVKGGGGATRPTRRVVGLKEGLQEEEFLRSLGPRILRRTKEEVLPWLPPKQYVEVVCEMEGNQLRQYKSLEADAEVVMEDGVLTVDASIAMFTRAKQVACGMLVAGNSVNGGKVGFGPVEESSKLRMLMQKLDDRGMLDDQGGDTKVLIASQFNELLDVLVHYFDSKGIAYHLMTGSTSDSKRDKMMQEFQGEGGPRIFILNSKAGGVSITLDAADELHCLDEMWSPEDNEQLEDRIHRASRNHQVTIYYYRSEGTIDMAIAEDVEGKRVVQHNVLDGRRGLEYVRNIIKYNPGRDAA